MWCGSSAYLSATYRAPSAISDAWNSELVNLMAVSRLRAAARRQPLPHAVRCPFS